LPLIAVVILGEVVGANISYFIGLRGGRPLLDRLGPRIGRYVSDAETFFERRGSATVFLGRFAPGIKNFVFTIAGVSRMRLAVFEAYTFAGAVAYSTLVIALGYFFGSNFKMLVRAVHGIGYGAFVLVIVLAGWIAFNRWEAARRHRLNEAAREAEGHDECD
jgi:membrane protein DedA with SNARE-associated domain